MSIRTTITRLASFFIAALLLACGGDESTPEASPARAGSTTSAATNALSAPTAPVTGKLVPTSQQGVSLVIPDGALPPGLTAEAIKITPAATTGADAAITSAGRSLLAYNLEPSGATFAKPIGIRFQRVSDNGSVPLAYHLSDTGFEVVSGVEARLNRGTGLWTVTVPVTHFSTVALDREGIFRGTLKEIDPVFVGQTFSTEITVERVRGAISTLEGGYTKDAPGGGRGKYVKFKYEYGTRGTWTFTYGQLGGYYTPWDAYDPGQVDAPGSAGPVLQENDTYRKAATFTCKKPGFHDVLFNSQIRFSSNGTLSEDGVVVERFSLDHDGKGEINGKKPDYELGKWTFVQFSTPVSCYGPPGTAVATAVPGTDPRGEPNDFDLDPNRPPLVTEIAAQLAAPVTTYSVTATDPDNNPLTYTWTLVGEECGTPKVKWTQQGASVRWSHADQTPDSCKHASTEHLVIATVLITDGKDTVECGITGTETRKIANPLCRRR